jgi:hypothetical protein
MVCSFLSVTWKMISQRPETYITTLERSTNARRNGGVTEAVCLSARLAKDGTREGENGGENERGTHVDV